MNYAYVNGKVLPAHKATISIFDRGLVLGDGIFETLRAVDYIPEFLQAHYSRLKKSAGKLRIAVPISQKVLGSVIYNLCGKSRLKDAAVRITLTRGEYSGGLSINRKMHPTLIVAIMPVSGINRKIYSHGVKVAVSSVAQEAAGGVDPTIKSLNYLGNILAKAEADRQKCYEAVLLGKNGQIAELSTSSFFCIINNEVFTPPIITGILPGVTRQTIINFLKKSSIPVFEKNLKITQVSKFAEAFLTSSIRGVVPIIKIGGIPVGTGVVGKISRQIGELYIESCIEDRNRLKRIMQA